MKLVGANTNAIRCVIARLRELIAALDRRTPRPERTDERQIAADSEALRGQAVERIAQLETESNPECSEMCARPSLRLRQAR